MDDLQVERTVERTAGWMGERMAGLKETLTVVTSVETTVEMTVGQSARD